jgi:RNA polymerase primary sigma factor
MNGGTDAVPEAGDDAADPSVQIVEKMSATKLRAKDRRAKEKALKEALERSYHGTEEDLEARRNKLKALIKLGKERGFLRTPKSTITCRTTVDAEAIDSIIFLRHGSGLRPGSRCRNAADEQSRPRRTTMTSRERAEAALTTVDEFGAPTPYACTCANGLGRLLTREARSRSRNASRTASSTW